MLSKGMAAQALVILVSILMGIGVAFGCSMIAGHTYELELSDESACRFFIALGSASQAPNLSDFIEKNGSGRRDQCETFNLTNEEDKALRTAILRYNHSSNKFGVITIRRLSQDAHNELLAEAESINSDECGCDRIAFVERIGNLTASLNDNGNCAIGASCRLIPPAGCLSRAIYDAKVGPLLKVTLLLLIGLVVLALLGALTVLGHRAFRRKGL